MTFRCFMLLQWNILRFAFFSVTHILCRSKFSLVAEHFKSCCSVISVLIHPRFYVLNIYIPATWDVSFQKLFNTFWILIIHGLLANCHWWKMYDAIIMDGHLQCRYMNYIITRQWHTWTEVRASVYLFTVWKLSHRKNPTRNVIATTDMSFKTNCFIFRERNFQFNTGISKIQGKIYIRNLF